MRGAYALMRPRTLPLGMRGAYAPHAAKNVSARNAWGLRPSSLATRLNRNRARSLRPSAAYPPTGLRSEASERTPDAFGRYIDVFIT